MLAFLLAFVYRLHGPLSVTSQAADFNSALLASAWREVQDELLSLQASPLTPAAVTKTQGSEDLR